MCKYPTKKIFVSFPHLFICHLLVSLGALYYFGSWFKTTLFTATVTVLDLDTGENLDLPLFSCDTISSCCLNLNTLFCHCRTIQSNFVMCLPDSRCNYVTKKPKYLRLDNIQDISVGSRASTPSFHQQDSHYEKDSAGPWRPELPPHQTVPKGLEGPIFLSIYWKWPNGGLLNLTPHLEVKRLCQSVR